MAQLSRMPAAARSPERVKAHHGCSQQVADRILSGERFTPSENVYDWLGYGVYFWEYGPDIAKRWARSRGHRPVAVLEATISLGLCVNLLDTAHHKGMRQSYQTTVQGLVAAGIPIPTNTYPLHNLDCLVLDSYCLDYSMLVGADVQTVRGCFPEGNALFTGSHILDKTHIQIAVRDPDCISDIKLVDLR